MPSPSKDVPPTSVTTPNIGSLCKCGQEMIHDIVQKTADLFNNNRFMTQVSLLLHIYTMHA